MIKKNFIILIFIIVLASFLRIYQLVNVPPSTSLDEASIGFNAYSILQTGKDEYGYHLPILLRAYDDYRPALYVYSVIPFVKLLGLNVLAVRLPSVIFSIISVFGVYFLVKEFFKKNHNLPKFLNSENIALLTAFLLAISPWHVYISRLGHEVNFGLSFLIFAVLFFLKKRIYLSTLFFVLSFMSYQSEKIFIPLFLLGIFFIFKKEILLIRNKILIALILGFLLLIPFIKASLEPNALIRFSATNILKANDSRFINQFIELNNGTLPKDLLDKFIFDRRLISFQLISEAYLSHFNPVWLFANSLGDNHKVPNLGLLYLWELPFILIGIYFLIHDNFDKKIKKLIFLWFILAPIPAAITTNTPHALRTFLFLPTWQIFSAIGILYFLNFFKSQLFKNLSSIIFVFIVLFSGLYFYRNYFYTFKSEQSKSFQYSLSQAIPFVLNNQSSYKKIVFDNYNYLAQSYMFFLFYSKYDPKLYLSQGGTKFGGYSASHKFGKYEFRSIDFLNESKGNLYVINYGDLSKMQNTYFKVIKIIKELDKNNSIALITK